MGEKPTIDEIARQTSHILKEYGDRPFSGSIGFHKDEIDVKGDGSLWAMAEYEVDYNWTQEPGDRHTPPVADFDVVGVRLKDANFFTNDGEEVRVSPEQATEVLVDYFQRNGLENDPVLVDKVHDQAAGGSQEMRGGQGF